ncbi:ammonia-forming cytochrome c nitrite reductase subunit c552 [Candidatus Poribacteria bacterium]|nr:ammonia-forming cytochrome c nitrite reductase subunit c552 [Candidatus Poribacteria bacterium]
MALLSALVLTILVVALLVSIFERKQEAKLTYFKVVEVKENEPNPAVWGQNFPRHYEALMRTMRTSELVKYSLYGRYGGSESFSKLDKYPEYRRLFAGYAFSVEYNEEQGHTKALEDMLNSKRLGDQKPGPCMTCKSSNVPSMMTTLGTEKFYATPVKELVAQFKPEYSISCADCHDAKTMALKITRPAFKEAMSQRGVDLSRATRQEMRTYVCAQCHVEYYFKGPGKYLVFPWEKGLKIEDIEAYYDEIDFKDWSHEETKTPLVKIQHPDFELWSTGIHARSGVACPDCHMSYKREGALKVSDHWVRTPLVNLTNSCATCHRLSEEELRTRVLEEQDRTYSLLNRAEKAILAAQDGIRVAQNSGVPDEVLKEAQSLHRKAFIRWDFISAENSMGFHSPQEAVRILGDAIDYARQGELAAYKAIGDQKR